MEKGTYTFQLYTQSTTAKGPLRKVKAEPTRVASTVCWNVHFHSTSFQQSFLDYQTSVCQTVFLCSCLGHQTDECPTSFLSSCPGNLIGASPTLLLWLSDKCVYSSLSFFLSRSPDRVHPTALLGTRPAVRVAQEKNIKMKKKIITILNNFSYILLL